MKKIGIYTIQSFNYGNRLQNYALQEVLRKMGFSVVSFKNSPEEASVKTRIKGILKVLFFHDQRSNFYRFNTYIRFSSQYIGEKGIKLNPKQYYALIAGSDQIWNTNFEFVTYNSFLPISHDRKIAYAASFGVDDISCDNTIVSCLNDFKELSVREDAGRDIISKYSSQDATVVVDPTMLLSRNEWRKIEKRPSGVSDGYVLTYFLSPMSIDAKMQIENVRGKRKVYELLNSEDKVVGNSGPAEFLWLIDHADIVITDSFHACVFSFLFDKPFFVYDRNWHEGNMNSRLVTLLKKFDLERKYVNSGLLNDIWEHDYSNGYRRLDEERKKAIDYLRIALGE